MEKLNLTPLDSFLYTQDDLDNFDCGNKDINTFFSNGCIEQSESYKSKTMVLNDNKSIIGFYTLAIGNLEIKDLENQNIIFRPYINIAYFAIQKEYQKKGIGKRMMDEVFKTALVVAYYVGVELIYLESVDESVEFYESCHFELINPRLRPEAYNCDTSKLGFPMYIAVKKIIELEYTGYYKNYTNNDL